MALYKRGKYWWFVFMKNGKRIVESTKSNDRRIAAEMQERRRNDIIEKKRIDEFDPGVYFVLAPIAGLIKIGCSGNVARRVETLQAASPEDLQLINQIQTKRYAEAESILHEFFKEQRVRREWFNLSSTDIDFAVRYWERIKNSQEILDRYRAMPVEREKLYSVEEISAILQVSETSVRKYIKREIPYIKYGNSVRVNGADLREFIDRHAVRKPKQNVTNIEFQAASEPES